MKNAYLAVLFVILIAPLIYATPDFCGGKSNETVTTTRYNHSDFFQTAGTGYDPTKWSAFGTLPTAYGRSTNFTTNGLPYSLSAREKGSYALLRKYKNFTSPVTFELSVLFNGTDDDGSPLLVQDSAGNYICGFKVVNSATLQQWTGSWSSFTTITTKKWYNITLHLNSTGCFGYTNTTGQQAFARIGAGNRNTDIRQIWVAYEDDTGVEVTYFSKYRAYNGSKCPTDSPTSSIMTYTAPTPANNSRNNTLLGVKINATCSLGARVSFWWNDTLYYRNATSPLVVALNTSLVPRNGDWRYKAKCNGSNDQEERHWYLDSVPPQLSIVGLTNKSYYKSNFYVNVTSLDDDNFNLTVKLANKTHTIFKWSNSTVNPQGYLTIRALINVTKYRTYNYTLNITAGDSHTVGAIADYRDEKLTKGIRYYTDEGGTISIEADSNADVASIKSTDRYSFTFSFQEHKAARTFTLKSEQPIIYLPKSKYKAHFIVYTQGMRGNWIDMEGLDETPKVTKISPFEYQIAYSNFPSRAVTFNSIGGLNVNEKKYVFYIDKDTPRVVVRAPAAGNKYNGSKTVNFIYNVSDFHPIDWCKLYVNNTIVQTDTTVQKQINQTLTYTFPTNGYYLYNVTCSDMVGHINASKMRNITINFTGDVPIVDTVYIDNIFHSSQFTTLVDLQGMCNVSLSSSNYTDILYKWYHNDALYYESLINGSFYMNDAALGETHSGNWVTFANTQDNDKTTGGYCQIAVFGSNICYYNVTYHISNYSLSVYWDLKQYYYEKNFTLPRGCFENHDIVRLSSKWRKGVGLDFSEKYCYNYSSGLNVVLNTSTDFYLYDENIFYSTYQGNYSVKTLHNVANISANVTTAGENWTFSCAGAQNNVLGLFVNSSKRLIIDYGIDDCTEYNITAFTFYVRDELTNVLTRANTTVDISYKASGSTYNLTYSKIRRNNNTFKFCKAPDYLDFIGDLTIQMEAPGYGDRIYFRPDLNLTGDLTGYLLESTATTNYITFTIIDYGSIEVVGADMKVYRAINGTNQLIFEGLSDFAGQVVTHLDQLHTYTFIITASGFPVKTFTLMPTSTAYTIRLSSDADYLVNNLYNGIRYKIVPPDALFNITGKYQNITLYVDGATVTEIGINFTNHNYKCLPASCSATFAGAGFVTVSVNMSHVGTFNTQYWFRAGGDRVYINDGLNKVVRFIFGEDSYVVSMLQLVRDNTGIMGRSVVASMVSLAAIAVGASAGMFGALLIIPAVLINIFLSLPEIGLIHPLLGLLLSVFGVAAWVMLGMRD